MPGGSQICGHFCRSCRGPRERAYHEVNPSRRVRELGGGEMPQPALDAIAADGVSQRSTDDEPNPRPGAAPDHPSPTPHQGRRTAWTTSVGRLTRIPRLVVRWKSFELCILNCRGNTVVAQARMSGGQTAAALAAPGRNDGTAGAGPHPQTKAMGTAATPITRLECALAHGKTPTIFGVLDNQVRCSRGTHRRWSGQVAAVAVSDLLTVRGTAKPVKPTRTRGD